jgi:MSHA pilin protein MshA
MSRTKGPTLSEPVIVVAILGVLAAIAVPKFVDLSGDVLTTSKKGMSGAVKSAHAIAIADLKRFPTVTELATYINGEGIAAAGTGIQVDIDGNNFTVLTYSDANCSTATAAVGDTVQCVGSIP